MEQTLENIKQNIRSVLISYPNSVSLKEFCRSYRDLLGTQLQSREFGFTQDIDFLYSVPDVVHIEVDKSGTHQLRALSTKSTEHIKKLVERQRTVKSKTNSKSKSSTSFKKHSEVTNSSPSSVRCRPFVPALMRAEIIQVVKLYPDGIGYAPFLMAYQSTFKRAPNLSWLSPNHQERLKQLANAIPELEVKVVAGQEKLHFVGQNSIGEKLTNGQISGKFARLAGLDKATSPTSALKSQHSNGLMDISAIPEYVKYNIEKILKRYPEGILAVHFPILYEKFTQKTFDLHELGYNSLLDLVDALPNIFFRVESPESTNDWKLFHVEFSANIADAKQASVALNGTPSQKHPRLSYLEKKTTVETAPPALQYIPAELPTDSSDQFFPVFVSAFINPSLFWFQLQTEDAIKNLQKLNKEMEYFYNVQVCGQYRLKDADVLIGSSCVAFFPDDNHWYRCVISSILNSDNVKVSLVDYGSWETISRQHLYYLKYSFILLPKQAFQAQLALVQPSTKIGTWEINAQNRFLELCNKSYIMAKVNSKEYQVVSLYLCDERGKEDILINDILVDEGLAEFSKQMESDNSMTDSGHHTPEKQVTEKSPEVENSVESSASSHTHLNNGCQTLNVNQTHLLFSKLKKLQSSKKRKSVRRIFLGDGYQIHIIIVENEAFVSGEDLCNILWKGKGAEVLAFRLEFKEVTIPTVSISKENYLDLFSQCEKYEVGGFNGANNNYSVILYPLKYSLKILNEFGHSSLKVRETLLREISEFNPLASVWNESEENGYHHKELTDEQENDLDKLCVYDLKIMRESLECKKLHILANNKKSPDEYFLNKMKEIELKRSSILQRIKEIEEICLKYSTEMS